LPTTYYYKILLVLGVLITKLHLKSKNTKLHCMVFFGNVHTRARFGTTNSFFAPSRIQNINWYYDTNSTREKAISPRLTTNIVFVATSRRNQFGQNEYYIWSLEYLIKLHYFLRNRILATWAECDGK